VGRLCVLRLAEVATMPIMFIVGVISVCFTRGLNGSARRGRRDAGAETPPQSRRRRVKGTETTALRRGR